MKFNDSVQRVVLMAAVLLLGVASGTAAAEQPRVPERFRGVTSKMTPDGLTLRIDILRWSSQEDREAVMAVLTGVADEDTTLMDLPTVGYVWPADSGLGSSLKYAHRLVTPDGGEQITAVTGRPLGKFDRESWTADGVTPPADHDFTVLELRLDSAGQGTGTMSLATSMSFDHDTQTVTLDVSETTPTLLDPVTREPEPYWAR